MENQQLIKKDRSANSYSKIFPWTFTDLVLDRVTKESLDNILVRNNFIALPYVGSKAATRLQVPMKNRRRGIWLSYIDYAGTLTVEYYNDNNLDNNHWQDSSYWLPYNTAEFQPASVGLSALAQEVFDWINSQITTAVKLNPEDLQKNSSGQIEEANRAYDTANFSGLGYRILRKNIQSNKNVLTQSMISAPNTVYEIRYDFDLNGNTISIPDNCELKFVGGSLKNGYLKGSLLNSIIDLSRIKVDDLGIFFSYFKLRKGQTVILEKDKTYTSSIDININASNITINGNNATIQSINTEHLSNIIEISPEVAIYYGLNIEATINSNIVSLGTIASDIQVGDYIQLRDSANKLNLNYHNGIYAIVLDKNGNDITLDVPYNSNIITYIEVYKPLDDIKIFDLTLGFNSSHGQRGIRLIKCRNSEIYNIKADGLGNLAGIYIDDCYYTKVHDCVLSKFFDIDRIVNMNGYGIGASGRNIEIYNNNVYDCRHCYAGDSRDYTSFIHIHDNTASYSYNTYTELNGAQPVIYAGMYDLHGNNKGIIENNIGTTTLLESGKWYGITVRESDVIIRNNTIKNNSNTFEGLAIILSELAYNNILIENNKITGRIVIGSVVTNLQLINNIFNDSFIDFSTISNNAEKSVNILYNKFYINNITRTIPIIQGKEQNYNYNIQGNIFIDEYNISSSVINISALASSIYIDNNLFILNNKTSVNVIVLPTSQITTFDLNSTISNNKFIVPNLPQSVDITNYWRGKYFDNYDSRLNSIIRAINILETTNQLPELGRTALEGTLFLCRDTHKMCVYNYNRYSGLDGRLINMPFATNYANVSTILSSLDSYKDVGLTLYITDRKQFVTYNGTTFVRTDGYEYNSTTVRIPSQLSEIEVSNCIYKIMYNFDLGGTTLTMPANCTLDFQGGSFSNGTIVGNNTKINAGLQKIFNIDIILNGTWNVNEAYPEWFGAVGNGVTNDTIALTKCINYFTITSLSARTYITDQIDNIPSFRTIRGCGKKSIIQANPSMELTNNYLLRTKDGGSGIIFSDFVLLGGSNSTEANYKIGGILLRSTSNDVNDQWDTRNVIQNVEIKNCYAASIYVGTYQRENKIVNCFISHTTNVGINCNGTDNMIIGCTVAGSHQEGIIINGNNRIDSCKCFGCGVSTTETGKYALKLIGNKCNVSNVELQQNNYGGCIIQGNSNYVQVTCDNNGSGTTSTVIGCSVVGSYNTVIVTSYNFSFHDDNYERYFVSTNWNTVGNNIIINGTPLANNKMATLSPWSIDNICNNILWNGFNLTQARETLFNKYLVPNKYTTNGTGTFIQNNCGLAFRIASATAINADVLSYSFSIPNAIMIDNNGCFSVKARFHKDSDVNSIIYPVVRIITTYTNSSGSSITRTDQNVVVNLLDNKDSLDVYALTSYHYLEDKPVAINSVIVEFVIMSKAIASGLAINAYFDDIRIGATTAGDKIAFLNEKGTTSARPTLALVSAGFKYYDTTLNKYIMSNGTAWTNLDGSALT